MPRKSKVAKMMDEEGFAVVPKEVVQPEIPELPVVSQSKLKEKIKAGQSERQKLATEKLTEANKIRWAENKIKKEEQTKLDAEEAKKKRKEQEEALIAAGTHIRVKVAPKRAYKAKAPAIQSEETATEDENDTAAFQAERPAPPTAQPSPVKASRSRKAPPPPSESETETDGEYKSRERSARRDVKKNLQALRSIDEALTQAAGNPYLALIASRWK
jgi:hypothetical protein